MKKITARLSTQEINELKYAVGLSNLTMDIKETLLMILEKNQNRPEHALYAEDGRMIAMVMSGLFIK